MFFACIYFFFLDFFWRWADGVQPQRYMLRIDKLSKLSSLGLELGA